MHTPKAYIQRNNQYLKILFVRIKKISPGITLIVSAIPVYDTPVSTVGFQVKG